jgi:hypothetical protein
MNEFFLPKVAAQEDFGFLDVFLEASADPLFAEAGPKFIDWLNHSRS